MLRRKNRAEARTLESLKARIPGSLGPWPPESPLAPGILKAWPWSPESSADARSPENLKAESLAPGSWPPDLGPLKAPESMATGKPLGSLAPLKAWPLKAWKPEGRAGS